MTKLADLSLEDQAVVRRALDAAANGPLFPDAEFQTLFGVTRDEVRKALARFPKSDTEDDRLAINNAFSMLAIYPHGQENVLKAHFHLERDTLAPVHKRLRKMWNLPAPTSIVDLIM